MLLQAVCSIFPDLTPLSYVTDTTKDPQVLRRTSLPYYSNSSDMKTLFGIILIAVLTGSTDWLTNFDEAKRSASQNHKLILLNFSGSDWCGPCIKMKKEVFENDAFQSLAEQRLVLVRADFPRQKKNQLPKEQVSQNEKLADQYNPEGKFPLTLLLDENGKVVKQWDGYVFASQEKFIADLKATIGTK